MNFDRNIFPKSVDCSFDILDNIFLIPGERKQMIQRETMKKKNFYY